MAHPLVSRFSTFDATAGKESRRDAPKTADESARRLKALIDHLPQRDVIDQEDIDTWVDRTLRMSIKRTELEQGADQASMGDVHAHALWHVRRASGIGGSEIGTIVKNHRGETGNFTSATNLAREKLLKMAPMRSTEEMARGIRAEPWIQKIYHQDTGARTDTPTLDLLRGFRWENRPFLIGTPDDIVFLSDGKRRITDYKAPSADVCAEYDRNGVSFDYVCQVHHYGAIAWAAGRKVTDMEIATLDPRSFRVVRHPVSFDEALIGEIMKAGRDFWDEHVMKGLIPEDIAPDKLDVADASVREMTAEMTMLKMTADEIAKRQNDLSERISLIASEWHALAEGRIDIGFAAFDRSRTFDEDTLVSLADASGIETEDFYEEKKDLDPKRAAEILEDLYDALEAGEDPALVLQDFAEAGVPRKRKLDTHALAAALEDAGVNTTPAAGIQERFTISRKKKGDEALRVAELRDEASTLADFLEDALRKAAPEILSGQRDAEPDVEECDLEMDGG